MVQLGELAYFETSWSRGLNANRGVTGVSTFSAVLGCLNRNSWYNTPSIIRRTEKMIHIDSKNALRVMKFDTEIAKT